jgi:hypothetical protein
MTRIYCKAYQMRELRAFHAWSEQLSAQAPELSDDDIVYLWDDFTVVQSPVLPEQEPLLARVTPEWRDFCTTTLKFALPEDVYAVSEASSERCSASH